MKKIFTSLVIPEKQQDLPTSDLTAERAAWGHSSSGQGNANSLSSLPQALVPFPLHLSSHILVRESRFPFLDIGKRTLLGFPPLWCDTNVTERQFRHLGGPMEFVRCKALCFQHSGSARARAHTLSLSCSCTNTRKEYACTENYDSWTSYIIKRETHGHLLVLPKTKRNKVSGTRTFYEWKYERIKNKNSHIW